MLKIIKLRIIPPNLRKTVRGSNLCRSVHGTTRENVLAALKGKTRPGFVADVPLREGMERTIQWTKKHVGVIDAAISRHAKFMKTETAQSLAPSARVS